MDMVEIYKKGLEIAVEELKDRAAAGDVIGSLPSSERSVVVETEGEFEDLMEAARQLYNLEPERVRKWIGHEFAHGRVAKGRCGDNVKVRYGIRFNDNGKDLGIGLETIVTPREGFELTPGDHVNIAMAPEDPDPADEELAGRYLGGTERSYAIAA